MIIMMIYILRCVTIVVIRLSVLILGYSNNPKSEYMCMIHVYVCVYMYIYTHTYIHTFIHTYIHTLYI